MIAAPRRVLIVEDELLIALSIADILDEAGFETVGPAGTVREAVALAQSEALDAALLDIELAGLDVYPAAAILAARQIPFAFVSSRPRDQIKEAFAARPLLAKPFATTDIEALVAGLIQP